MSVQVRGTFGELRGLKQALEALQQRGLREVRVFSPVGLPELGRLLPRRGSPVRFLVLAAALAGCGIGFWMSIGSAWTYGLIVGAKHPTSVLPYCIPGFEFTILFGGVTAFFVLAVLAALSPRYRPAEYDPRFNEDKFGVVVECAPERAKEVAVLLRDAGAEEVDERSSGDN